MIEISKMKYRGCCFNCLKAMPEEQIYKIEIGKDFTIELCEDCASVLVKEMNEKISKIAGGSNDK